MGRTKAVIAALVLAICGGAGYYAIAQKQKKDQQRAVAALLGDTTAQLRKALKGPVPPAILARIDDNLKQAKAPRDRELADAAGDYIQGAREIVRHRGDADRLAREALKSRDALARHMKAASGRDTYWIRIATDLKKRVERDHQELDISLKTLSHLLFTLPEASKRLEPRVDHSLLLEEAETRDARQRAEEAAKRAAEELEKSRRLVLPTR
jgi:hypothetical protein